MVEKDEADTGHAADTQPVPRVKKTRRLYFLAVPALLAAAVIGGAVYFYGSYTSSPEYIQKKAEAEVQSLVDKVGKKMLLPEGIPTVFVVSDPQVLISQQAFFAGAEAGDKLLVYTEASKAIIYSESRDMIINVGPITFDQPAPAAADGGPLGAPITPGSGSAEVSE